MIRTLQVPVDGADFNNPFFGEQRGGQRPAFTFNLDAVLEYGKIAATPMRDWDAANSDQFVRLVFSNEPV